MSRDKRPTVGIPQSPFFTLEECALFCRFDATAEKPLIACRKWLRRNSIPVRKLGRRLLVDRRVLEAKLEEV